MKVYLTPPQPSRGLQRIADALVKYKPEWVEAVSTQAEADVVIIYAIGRCEALSRQVMEIVKRDQRFAMIQICLKSTQKPNAFYWFPMWADAAVVWSYYNLNYVLDEDGEDLNDGTKWELANFYHAPLGVESDTFYPREFYDQPFSIRIERHPMIFTSGLSYLSESVRECWLAAEEANIGRMHLGLVEGKNVETLNGVTDDYLAEKYSQCSYVSALRRKEGFELPAAEGLLCGARPIAFDTPDYRWIYKSWAEYIHEGTRQEVVDQLIELFRRGARSVTQDEINEARQWFHWPTIVGGFYERLR